MYRITNINTGANLGAVDKVVYIRIGASGDFTPTPEEDAIGVALNLSLIHISEPTRPY